MMSKGTGTSRYWKGEEGSKDLDLGMGVGVPWGRREGGLGHLSSLSVEIGV